MVTFLLVMFSLRIPSKGIDHFVLEATALNNFDVNNLKIQLPKVFNDVDRDWIFKTLQTLTFNERQRAIIKYVEVYREAYDKENLYYKKENAAGRAANIRLRQFAVKCAAKRNEEVRNPPILKAE